MSKTDTPSTMLPKDEATSSRFSRYETWVIALIAFTQFTVILDFMVMSPLGAILLKTMGLHTKEFGTVVSAYALSAGISGFLSAGFADRFDRKKMLMVFYIGFIVGTLLCAFAYDYTTLVAARIFTGIFGGVIGSISMAIVTDIFAPQTRGRVMGFIQTAFAASQVLGIPIGLALANAFSWHMPFYMIVGISTIGLICIARILRPVPPQTHGRKVSNPFKHLFATLTNKQYVRGFLATITLALGGFMMMPFGSAFSTNNLGISIDILPVMFAITGLFSMVSGPLIGKFSDKFGAIKMFAFGSLFTVPIIFVYTNLGTTPFAIVTILNVLLFTAITARIISSMSIVSRIPAPQDRGAFMSINTSLQQAAGGVSSIIAGYIIYTAPDGKLVHYDTLGIIVNVSMVLGLGMMMYLNNSLKNQKPAPTPTPVEQPAAELL